MGARIAHPAHAWRRKSQQCAPSPRTRSRSAHHTRRSCQVHCHPCSIGPTEAAQRDSRHPCSPLRRHCPHTPRRRPRSLSRSSAPWHPNCCRLGSTPLLQHRCIRDSTCRQRPQCRRCTGRQELPAAAAGRHTRARSSRRRTHSGGQRRCSSNDCLDSRCRCCSCKCWALCTQRPWGA
jgi:hypothetical protein